MSSYCAFHWVCEDIDIPLKILGWSFPWRLKALFFLACYSAKHLIDLIISLVQLHKEVNSWLQQLWVQSEPQQHVAEQEYQGIILALCPGQDRTHPAALTDSFTHAICSGFKTLNLCRKPCSFPHHWDGKSHLATCRGKRCVTSQNRVSLLCFLLLLIKIGTTNGP